MMDNGELDICEAGDGKIGVEIAKEEKPDLIFTDVMMPNCNGYEACRLIKNNPGTKDTFIILLTAKGQNVDKEKGLSAGADLYMTKPFDLDQIVSKIEEILAIKRSCYFLQ